MTTQNHSHDTTRAQEQPTEHTPVKYALNQLRDGSLPPREALIAPLLLHRDTEVRTGVVGSRDRVSVGREHEYEDGVAVFVPITDLGGDVDAVEDFYAKWRGEMRERAPELACDSDEVYCWYDGDANAWKTEEQCLTQLIDVYDAVTEEHGHPTIESALDEILAAVLHVCRLDTGPVMIAARGAGHGGRVRFRREPEEWYEREPGRPEGGHRLEGVEGVTVFVPASALHTPLKSVWAAAAGDDGEQAWRLVPDAP